ncbi:MAG: ABC transporter substrate-binding protein [Firmicutes bacterium]|nr:ABC transporter substrate-binding protein [Bacillota bacterium]
MRGAKGIAASAAALGVFLAATAGAGAAAGKTPYVVGFINHLTGPAAVYGQSMMKGTELAVAQINARGGIDGHPLKVIYKDDQLNPSLAVSAFNTLVGVDHVPVVMGSGSSTVTLALVPLATRTHTVLISSISTSPLLAGSSPWFFGVMADDNAQGAEWVKVAKALHVTRAAVMYINNDYGVGVMKVFDKDFAAAGGKVLVNQSFPQGGTDFRTDILKVEASGAKTVFIVGHVQEAGTLLAQAGQMGFHPQWVGDTALNAPQFVQLAGAEANGMILLSAGNHFTAAYRRFSAAFTARFHEAPTIWSDFAYDTTNLVARAIARGGYDAAGIRAALAATRGYVGASGVKTFQRDGFTAGNFDWYRVRNGQIVFWHAG